MSFVSEQFDVGTGLPLLGDFRVNFRAGSIQRLLGPFVAATSTTAAGPSENWKHSLLVVTDGRVGAPDRSAVLARALFAGEVLRFDFPGRQREWSIGGPSALNWLGDADDKGPGISVGTDYPDSSHYTGTLANYLPGLTAGGGTNGVGLDATAASVSTTAMDLVLRYFETARVRINKLCQATDPRTEFYFDPSDLTCYFQGNGDTTNAIFQWTPKVLFSPDVPGSREASMVSFDCQFGVGLDYGAVATGLRVAKSDGTTGYSSGTTDPLPNDITGAGTGSRSKYLGADDELYYQYGGNPLYDLWSLKYTRNDTVRITVDDPNNVRRDLKPGDYCYLYDGLLGIQDTANSLYHGGMSVQPRKARCSGVRWPVREGNGVYLVHIVSEYGGVNAVQDVTDEVVFGTGGTTVDVATSSPLTMRSVTGGSFTRSNWRAI